MKKMLLGFLSGIILCAVTAFTVENYIVTKRTAEVEKINGYFVYTDCSPVAPYEVIGEIKSGSFGKALGVSAAEYKELRDKLISKSHEKYKDAEGIIFQFNNGAADFAQVIVFKK